MRVLGCTFVLVHGNGDSVGGDWENMGAVHGFGDSVDGSWENAGSVHGMGVSVDRDWENMGSVNENGDWSFQDLSHRFYRVSVCRIRTILTGCKRRWRRLLCGRLPWLGLRLLRLLLHHLQRIRLGGLLHHFRLLQGIRVLWFRGLL